MRKIAPHVHKNAKTHHVMPNIIPKYTLKDMTSDGNIFNDVAVRNFAGNNKVCITSENIQEITNVKYLVINDSCPQMIPVNITHVLIYFYDKSLILPSNITHLVLSDFFNKEITLPLNLEYLQTGYSFNQKLMLPNTLRTLIINSTITSQIVLPENLEKLVLSGCFNQELVFPKSLKYLQTGMFYKRLII